MPKYSGSSCKDDWCAYVSVLDARECVGDRIKDSWEASEIGGDKTYGLGAVLKA
jgi:hypothetical protein